MTKYLRCSVCRRTDKKPSITNTFTITPSEDDDEPDLVVCDRCNMQGGLPAFPGVSYSAFFVSPPIEIRHHYHQGFDWSDRPRTGI